MLGLGVLMMYVVALIVIVGALARVTPPEGDDPEVELAERDEGRLTTGSLTLVSVAVAVLWFLAVDVGNFTQTSALFVGVPAILALAVMFLVKPRSAVGVTCKALTFALLLSLMFLGEGVLCIVMAAPLFYAVAIVIGRAIEAAVANDRGRARRLHSCVVLAVLLTSVEGVTPLTSLNRDVWVSETRLVAATVGEVGRALMAAPRFERALPRVLRFGFPRPVASRFEEGPAGAPARWIVRFRGGETRLNGQEPAPGDLVLDLVESRPGRVRWIAASDDSHMTHFLRWQESVVTWEPAAAAHTRITWSLRYRRDLDPAWYFGPLEAVAARHAAGYLIDAVATP